MRIAVIDLGSNSVRMNIININDKGAYHLIDQAKEMVRLSEGMGPEKVIKEVPQERTIRTLVLFNKLIEAYHVDEVYAIATAAVREAINGKIFLERIKLKTGLEFRVITGLEEAYYDYLGVVNTMMLSEFMMLDIGGASTEIAYVKDRQIVESISIPYGSVNITENLMGGKNTKKSVKQAEDVFRQMLNAIPWIGSKRGIPIVGLGGTIRSIAKNDKAIKHLNMNAIHNYRLKKEDFDRFIQLVDASPPEVVKHLPGINKNRADIIQGGLVPARVLMSYIQAPHLVVSGNGLKEGVFYEAYYFKGKPTKLMDDVLMHSVENAMMLYNVNVRHATKVMDMSQVIFEGLKGPFSLGESEQRLLNVAAKLHDIGMYIDYYYHHYHGYYLAMNSRIAGLELRETVMVALIIGMHRESKLKVDWTEYNMLMDKHDFLVVQYLSMMLRLAEKLDRSESASSLELKFDVDVHLKTCVLHMKAENGVELETAAVSKFTDSFFKLFRYHLTICENK